MRKTSKPVVWSGDDWSTLRFAPAIDAEEHVKTFAIFGLLRCFEDFGVGSFEASGVAEWYWKSARSWPRKQTQSEFNKYARARISDHVGFSRRRADAFHVVNALFDKARFLHVDLNQIVDAVSFLSKTESLPPERVFENRTTTLIDVTRRSSSPKLLKVDADFFPVLTRLYPFEHIRNTVIKAIPVGTATRDFPLVQLCWWSQNPNTTLEEMQKAIRFHDGDPMNWTKANLYSKWRAAAAAHESGVPAELPESGPNANGDITTGDFQYVGMSEGLSAGLSMDAKPAKSTKTLNRDE